MKKLFLYIAIVLVIFFVSYGAGMGIYRLYYEKQTSDGAEEQNVNLSDSIEYPLQQDTVLEDFRETAGPAEAKATEEVPVSTVSDADKEPVYQYKLSYSGGYVVVVNQEGILFEYTDIEKTLLPEHIINEINNGLYFDNLENVYDYLESIAS